MRKYKAIVVGAGPAGSFTAETLKRRASDLEVHLFERLSEPGKRACGEAIGKEGLERLGIQLPNECVVRSFEKITCKWTDEFIKEAKTSGYMIDRWAFNKYFAERAKKVGCELYTSREVIDVRRVNSKWKVEIMNLKDGGTTYFDTYDLLIDAGGSRSSLSVKTNILTKEEHEKWEEKHVFGFQDRIRTNVQRDDLYFDFTPDPDPGIKYHYQFFHHDELTNIGVIFDKEYSRTYEEPQELIKRFVKKIGIGRYDVVETTGGEIPGGGLLPKIYGNGAMVVGDAAGQTNPLFFAGLTPALICGKIAGEVGAEAYQKGSFDEKFLLPYQERIKKEGLANPILLDSVKISNKLRERKPVSKEEFQILAKALDITKSYY